METKIITDLWQVGGPGFTSPDDAAVYLLRIDGRAAIVDAGHKLRGCETHGLAQRGGVVVSHLRIGDGAFDLHDPDRFTAEITASAPHPYGHA